MSIHRGACPTLETDRLVLRPFRDDDVDDYFAVLDSPEVGALMTGTRGPGALMELLGPEWIPVAILAG